MKKHDRRIRCQFQLESLEGRIALSSVSGADGHRGRAAEMETHRHGQDDPAGHDANDDRGGMAGRHGADDGPGHDANHGQHRRGRH